MEGTFRRYVWCNGCERRIAEELMESSRCRSCREEENEGWS